MDAPVKKKFSFNNLNTADRQLSISAIISVISFFLPWIIMRGFFNSFNLGVMLLSPFISRASGLPLGLVILTPLSALVMLLLLMPKFNGSKEKFSTGKVILQFVVLLIGAIPFYLVPVEIKTWSGGTVNISIGFWIAVLAHIAMLIFTIKGLSEE